MYVCIHKIQTNAKSHRTVVRSKFYSFYNYIYFTIYVYKTFQHIIYTSTFSSAPSKLDYE